jgi:hypothetical protein
MNSRSSNTAFVHFGGDVVSNVESSHGVQLTGGSTGGVVQAFGDDANVSLTVTGKGSGRLILGSTASAVTLNSTTATFGSASTTPIALMQRYLVQFTVPALSSASSAESTVTVTGLTTNSCLFITPRLKLNSTVTGVALTCRCSTVDELTIIHHNISQTSLSGSTQSAYLFQISF